MKILIVEDEEFDYRLVKRNLERAFQDVILEFEWVRQPVVSDLCLIVDQYDICFIDQNLGPIQGVDLIRALSESGVITPLILLTGDETRELDQSALNAGAADFLHKDKLSVSSINRLTRYCLARKEQEQRLVKMAYTDTLTGLSNRAAFDQRCNAALSTSRKTSRSLALILLDLDKFKAVNDTYGHPAGDSLLIQFSAELASHFGPNDMVARLGGDEFGVLLDLGADTGRAEDIRDWLRSVMKTQFMVQGKKLEMHCSIGVCVVDPTSAGMETTDVLNRADRNLYTDKRLQNLGESDGGLRALDLAKVIPALEQALDKDAFEIVYQPKVNYASGHITGLEALLRWNNPEINLGPAEFIPLAEQHGLIREIGKWVIRRCCAQLAEWSDNGQTLLPVAINISPDQLVDDNFAVFVEMILLEFGIRPELVEFELTEGAFGRRLDACLDQMERTASLGCKWAIDDFGVGYSSLSRLHRLPISKLKIDKSFLVQLPTDTAAREISNTIISLARSLKMGIVAEGVEDFDQLDGLNLGEGDELQGYRCYRPLPAIDMTRLLSNMPAPVALLA